jgi:hypothetical protein
MFGSIVVVTMLLIRLVIPFALLLFVGTVVGQRNRTVNS